LQQVKQIVPKPPDVTLLLSIEFGDTQTFGVVHIRNHNGITFRMFLIISIVSPIEIPSLLGFNSSLITASNSISYFSLNSLCQDS
jgi:hypothetical protein